MRSIRYIIRPGEDGQKVGAYLRGVAGISRRLLVDLKKTDYGIRCNGVHIRVIDRVHSGDELVVTIDDHPKEYVAAPLEVPILYEDEDLLVYNKPSGMASHQSRRHQTDSLGNAFAWYCQQKGLSISFRPVSRLDKDTSGIVIVAKNQHAASKLSGAVEKRYYAVVCGRMEQDTGIVEAPIKRINEIYTKRMVSAEGQYAKTQWQVISRGEKYTFIQLKLYTGRTHQIRVHMAHIGHPLAGDDLYGGNLEIIPRQALHCGWVRFYHPLTGNPIEITAPMYEDMEKAISFAGGTVQDF